MPEDCDASGHWNDQQSEPATNRTGVKTCDDDNMTTVGNMKSEVRLAISTLSSIRPRNTVSGTAANKNHLNCWRSLPLVWCSRRMGENRAARLLVSSSVIPRKREDPNKL